MLLPVLWPKTTFEKGHDVDVLLCYFGKVGQRSDASKDLGVEFAVLHCDGEGDGTIS